MSHPLHLRAPPLLGFIPLIKSPFHPFIHFTLLRSQNFRSNTPPTPRCCTTPPPVRKSFVVSRRLFLAAAASVAAALLSTTTTFSNNSTAVIAVSGVPPSLQGQVTLYKDLGHGFTIWRPVGWNEFEGQVDQYDIKWQDVIEPMEIVTVSAVESGRASEVGDLGGVQEVSEKLAKTRSATLLNASEVEIGGGDYKGYEVEMKIGGARILTLLTVNRKKLFSVNASCSERRWNKRAGLLKGVVQSFIPRL